MALPSILGGIFVLILGAMVTNFVSQSLEGRDRYFLHFGWVTLVVVAGAVASLVWGWVSTAWTLGVAAGLSIAPALWHCYFGEGPTGYFYHGDDPNDVE